jgi:hypothetical protein
LIWKVDRLEQKKTWRKKTVRFTSITSVTALTITSISFIQESILFYFEVIEYLLEMFLWKYWKDGTPFFVTKFSVQWTFQHAWIFPHSRESDPKMKRKERKIRKRNKKKEKFETNWNTFWSNTLASQKVASSWPSKLLHTF